MFFFFRKFFEIISTTNKKRRQSYDEEEIEEMRNILTSPSLNIAKHYYIKNQFTLMDDNVIVKKRGGGKIISEKEIYSTIYNSHVACGHGGDKRTYHEVRKHRKIVNVTIEQIKKFISLCEVCQKKRQHKKKNSNCLKIKSSKFGERGQIDLIDLSMNVTNDGYKYILNYQDHLTKFVILKPLKSKKGSEINESLLDIFTTVGVPQILQCDNGNEFSEIKEKLFDKYWPACKIVRSRPRHPQSQGSVERANGDIMNMLRCWMHEESSSDWVRGLKFIQMHKNNAFNRSIKCSPFYATFGREIPIEFIGCNLEETNEEISNEEMSNEEILNNVEDINSIRETVSQELNKNINPVEPSITFVAVGTPVIVKIPKIDCPKLAFPNIIGVIYKYITDIEKYEIKTKYGIIDRKFSRMDFQLCPNLNICLNDDDNNDHFITLRELVRLDCAKFVGCKCFGKCQNRVCFCYKLGKICDSFCKHKGSNTLCMNKASNKIIQTRQKKL